MVGLGGTQRVRQAGVIAAGLALGLGAFTVFDRDAAPRYRPGTPSVTEFAFSTSVPEAPPAPAEVVPVLAEEPAGARSAVVAFLQPLADGRPERAYPLLDEASRRRYPTLAAWVRAQPDRATPLTFSEGPARPSRDRPGAFEVEVEATHRPSLDPIRGLVPASSTSVWVARQEAGAWRVAADPVSSRPDMPDEAQATGVVQDWVSLLAACDTPAAASLQVSANLYGPASLVRAPCEMRGTWTAGAPSGLDRTPDPRAFLAAFGPDVGSWARLVPVQGPGSRFLAAVAPLGDSWQVMGVAVDAS